MRFIETHKKIYTPEQYLELEEQGEFRNEYRNGIIIPMAGGTTNHNQIVGNLYANLKFSLKGKDYRVFMADVRLWIPRYLQYTYPDLMIIQGQTVYTGTRMTTVMNPLLIAEVLSKSTKNYDQGDKFLYYRSIPEFKEYILIDQYRYHVMQYVKKAENQWLLAEIEDKSATLSLQTIEFKITLNELYEQVNFAASDSEG